MFELLQPTLLFGSDVSVWIRVPFWFPSLLSSFVNEGTIHLKSFFFFFLFFMGFYARPVSWCCVVFDTNSAFFFFFFPQTKVVGGGVSWRLITRAPFLLHWTGSLNISLLLQFLMGVRNVVAGSLGHRHQFWVPSGP